MFWERLFECCEDKKIKPNNLTSIITVSSATITKWKNGTIPNGELLVKISDYFDISIDYLMGRTNIKNPFGKSEGLSEIEKTIINAYRAKPDMQKAVERLLEIDYDTNIQNKKQVFRQNDEEIASELIALAEDEVKEIAKSNPKVMAKNNK